MRVLVACNDPAVQVAGFDGGAVLDLVAHFLGIATHHNDNAEPGSAYGESVQSVGVTVASGMRVKLRMVPDTLAHSAEDADNDVCFGVISASCDAVNEHAQAVRTKPADCSRWFSVTNDRRFVVRPARSVVRATSVFGRAGRSRRCAWRRHSRDMARAG